MTKKLKGGVYCDPANLLRVMQEYIRAIDELGSSLCDAVDLAKANRYLGNRLYIAGLMEGYEPDDDMTDLPL